MSDFQSVEKLLCHYPIAGCSYIKRGAEGVNWEDEVDNETVTVMREIVEEERRQDPVGGKWHAPKSTTV